MTKRSTENSATALRRIAAALVRISNEVEQLELEPDRHEQVDDTSSGPSIFFGRQDLLLQAVQANYSERRRRKKFFPADLFGEAAWDILLDLFAARLERRRISVTSACIGADVPSTTGLRWLGQLEALGLIERVVSETDQRVTWVRLSDACAQRMNNYYHSRPISSTEHDHITSSLLVSAKEDG